MRRKEKTNLVIEDLEIIDAGAEGNAVGRAGEIVIFVKNAVPGDIVDVIVYKKKKKYAEARIINIKKHSERRVKPECEHFGFCGGCKWQNMSYQDQLFFKQKQVEDSLFRIGKLEINEILPIKPAGKIFFYRNKLDYSFSLNRWLSFDDMNNHDIPRQNALGFHIPQHFDKVIDINKCHLQQEPSNNIRIKLKEFAVTNKISFYDPRNRTGFLRNLIIRNTTESDLMVIMVFGFRDEESIEKVCQFLASEFPEITSLVYIVNEKFNDSISDLEAIIFKGKEFMTESFEDKHFKIGPLSFFQTNSLQALELYRIIRDFAELNPSDIVYDLYTGTGSIAIFISGKVKKVVGVEFVEAAINDAKNNAKSNNVINADFFAGDMAKVLDDDFVLNNGRPDIIITDPPRSGMHQKVVEQIIKISPERIVYVSCNPATQARDAALLKEFYYIVKTQAVDMFPHTQHVENVMLLKRK
jgi:23S rRNA (uracil1939-C5)-methyltransferase